LGRAKPKQEPAPDFDNVVIGETGDISYHNYKILPAPSIGTRTGEKSSYIERYPYIKFPVETYIGKTVPLKVLIRVTASKSRAPSIPLRIITKAKQKAVPIYVILNPKGFEVLGDNCGMILVPSNNRDSHPLTFKIKAISEGVHSIDVKFYQNSLPIGKIAISSLVKRKKTAREIIKPWREEPRGEHEYLSEKYNFSRWLDVGLAHEKLDIEKILLIIPSDSNLPSLPEERNWILRFSKEYGIDVSLASKHDEVISALKLGGFDMIHISSHGRFDNRNSLFSTIDLEGCMPLRPSHLSGEASRFGESNPIVILNACQTGNQGFSLTGVQGWAEQFLTLGASVFIGTLWSVSDGSAFNFVKELYRQMTSNTIGESVRLARGACKKKGDPSWLAYGLYGHPNFKINFSSISR
jgi:hypothetical protein